MARKRKKGKKYYEEPAYQLRNFARPIVTKIKRTPVAERQRYLFFLKPYLTDEEYNYLIQELRGQLLL